MPTQADEEHGSFYVTQSVAFFNKKGEFLALRHRDEKWLLVAGHMNKRKGWKPALELEIREEMVSLMSNCRMCSKWIRGRERKELNTASFFSGSCGEIA